MKQKSSSLAIYFAAAIAAALAGFLSGALMLTGETGRGEEALAPPPAAAAPTPEGLRAFSSASPDGVPKLVVHEAARPAPDIAFRDASGAARRLGEWRGKVVLLNLWATWCAPCKVEMPALDRLQAKLGGEDFAVIALSLDRAGVTAPRRFFSDEKLQALDLFIDDTGEAGRALKAAGLPTTVILDREGREIARLAGIAEWDEGAALAFLRAAIKD